ncbi:AEC family transporter [Buchananella hordeovulneris]|uniref:AEC family transporter n=1 Tax=Buchananella hordeovulneris TaxID=52770 RepID=UPI000F6001C9|nr:AEC family transporter [Buchananella hordeovulneris]RRD42592.1 AEC family transporter [Buchananella hordeovulneris]
MGAAAQVLGGFAGLGAIVLIGYVLAARGLLVGATGLASDDDRLGSVADTLTRVCFFAATPALLFHSIVQSRASFASRTTLVSVAVPMVVIGGVTVWSWWRSRRWGSAIAAGMCAGYVNAGNLGLPISVLLLGDASPIAPVLLLQQGLVTPVALMLLDRQARLSAAAASAEVGWLRAAWQLLPLRHPPVVAVLSALVVRAVGWQVPDVVLTSVRTLGGAAVPLMLLAFGISLRGRGLPGRGRDGHQVWALSLCKLVVAPALALGAGAAWGFSGPELAVVAVTAGLPTAQNVFLYTNRFKVGHELARQVVAVTTLLCVPGLVAARLLWG